VIPVENAFEIVLAHTPCLPSEEIDFQDAPGRVLVEDIRSDMDLPPFRRSTVDGFALRAEESRRQPVRLKALGTIPAGTFPSIRVEPGTAAQIMTGAPVPEGADAVQMVEKTRMNGSEVDILESVSPGENVVPRGSEVTKGDRVLKKGTRMDSASVAVAATVGRIRLRVGSRPRVAVIATGDELVSPNEKPGPGRIRNSNGFSLLAQARAAGAEVTYLGVAKDNEESLTKKIEEGLTHDVLLISGGVSMGRLDLVEDVLKALHVNLLIESVAVKPGKPLVFGTGEDANIVFGLPGNPVSTLVTFELFVRPALAKMEGSEQLQRVHLTATLCGPLASRGPRRAFLPGWVEARKEDGLLLAHPIPTRGSGDVVAFSKANALLILPEELDRLETGRPVRVYPLDGFYFKEDRWHAGQRS
jgi:molybdopterin molybdotransferase